MPLECHLTVPTAFFYRFFMTLRASTNPSCASESTCGTAAFSFELCHLNLQSNWKHCKVCSMSTWTPKHFELFTIVNNYSLNSIQYVHWMPFAEYHSPSANTIPFTVWRVFASSASEFSGGCSMKHRMNRIRMAGCKSLQLVSHYLSHYCSH